MSGKIILSDLALGIDLIPWPDSLGLGCSGFSGEAQLEVILEGWLALGFDLTNELEVEVG